ncbi:hypothetical protein [Sutcliffiella halmapala]|uniref:hypothetical protein n=1 Tax=Sutcliffiella halmapala TaxID=79882 RepID=UPI000994B3D1|nr:hypothetical protein [Sutcliffiella halmapala]
MEYFIPVFSFILLGVLVFSGSSVLTFLNKKVHFVVVIIPMVSVAVIYSMIADLTNLLPILITMTTILSLLGNYIVKSIPSTKRLTEDLNKQTN